MNRTEPAAQDLGSTTPKEGSDLCFSDGIDGATGEYLFPPARARDLADLARREPRYSFPGIQSRSRESGDPRGKGVGEGVDPGDLGQAGWGVVFAESTPPEVREAMRELLDHRQRLATRDAAFYHEFTYLSGETKTSFLGRHGVAPGAAFPERMPYYLLLVGSPEEISFAFQYQLDVQYAVGRIHFDSPEEYARYSRSVVAAETSAPRRARSAFFFGPRNPNDPPTSSSSDHLVAPLATGLARARPDWTVRTTLRDEATKACLSDVFEGEERPALLFTAGHGLCFRMEDPRQLPLQGSLVCQDWPGPGQPICENHYFQADDLSSKAQVAGLIAFHFSCYGIGTPHRDDFLEPVGEREIAPRPFLSRLAQRLLAHPAGGALAVIGHVDRAWGWSFFGAETGHRGVFENAFKRLLGGAPLGHAMEYFSWCYTELASDLDDEIRRNEGDQRLASLWTHRNDVRNYAVLGDPAVRLATGAEEGA